MSNQYIVEGMYRGFAAGDVAAVVAAFADDFAWTEADGFPLAGTSVGPQAVVENVFMRLGEFSDNGSVSIDRYIADGDTVVADGRYTWNHKETGEPCEVRMAHIWTFEDGKAKSFLQHVDSKRLQEQVA
ncbi:MAG: nuclear transport factor 2 family protein [Woeseiaceae bacterium]|nr:nuclear transport factor 2 family protein [Woeseiaceae bacterium]